MRRVLCLAERIVDPVPRRTAGLGEVRILAATATQGFGSGGNQVTSGYPTFHEVLGDERNDGSLSSSG